MLNYLRLRRRLRIDSTKKWFDDLNYISGLHIHDGEVDALAILVGEVRRQYVWHLSWYMQRFRGAHYWQITCGWPDWRRDLLPQGEDGHKLCKVRCHSVDKVYYHVALLTKMVRQWRLSPLRPGYYGTYVLVQIRMWSWSSIVRFYCPKCSRTSRSWSR